MDFRRLDDRKILITLEKQDMEDFSLSFQSLNITDDRQRNTLLRILQLAMQKSGVSFEDKFLTVEALPYLGGCLLLVTFSEKTKKPKTYRVKRGKTLPYVKFLSVDDLLDCGALLNSEDETLMKNSLWLSGENYFLLMDYPYLSKRQKLLLSQYGKVFENSPATVARIRESGKLIKNGNAMKALI
ncbi:MAG: adaptor protein MecA [Eubacteriales bacterium]|nr:adaptor protein MecA [Eubacteriales bacterium]